MAMILKMGTRRKMADFLSQYCGEYGAGKCKCKDRVNYAIQNHRINPSQLDFTSATAIKQEQMLNVKKAMEEIDDLSQQFSFCRYFESTDTVKQFLVGFLNSTATNTVMKA